MQLKDRITQGMLEDFEAKIKDAAGVGLAKFRGITARAAHETGWVDGDIDIEDPHVVYELSEAAMHRYQELLTLDPHNNGGGDARPQSEAEPAAG